MTTRKKKTSVISPGSTGHPSSWTFLKDQLRRDPRCAVLFLDTELTCLLASPPIDPGLSVPLIGEGLLRLWLYDQRCPTGLRDTVQHAAGPRLLDALDQRLSNVRHGPVSGDTWNDLADDPSLVDEWARAAWSYACQRAREYRNAHGIIALVGGASAAEAIALPFTLTGGEETPGTIRDADGREITQWTLAVGKLTGLVNGSTFRVVLRCHDGPRTRSLEGGSFALAVLAALQREKGIIADYDPLDVLFTGDLDAAGSLLNVSGIPAKTQLAQRLGISLFVYPGTIQKSPDRLAIPPGTPARECIDRIARHLDALGMDSLNARQANQRIRELKNEIHEGLLPLEQAVRRLDRYESVFHGEPGSEYANEGMIYAAMLRGAMANHGGDPETGRGHLHRAAQLAQQSKNPLVQMHSLGNMIVSLTDLGLLDEAENEARDLLKWVSTEFHGNTEEKIEARMVAAGVLGGQPLLQKALADPSLAAESLELLGQALDNARQLQQNPEIARDASQIALWYALLDPLNAPAQIEIAQREIRACGKDGDVSEQFLCNYRFLAAYRAILGNFPRNLHGGTTSVSSADNLPDMFRCFTDWPLPQAEDWLLGTALKCRGCLHAVAGHADGALADFEQACAKLGHGNQVLIRFIGATAALQAADSLRLTHPAKSKDFAQQAHAVFESIKDILYGPHRDPSWIARARILAKGADPQGTDNPQLRYRY